MTQKTINGLKCQNNDNVKVFYRYSRLYTQLGNREKLLIPQEIFYFIKIKIKIMSQSNEPIETKSKLLSLKFTIFENLKIVDTTRHNFLLIPNSNDINEILIQFIKEHCLDTNKYRSLGGISKSLTFKELQTKTKGLEHMLMHFTTLMHVCINENLTKKQMDPKFKNIGIGFLDSFVRELSRTLTISHKLNFYFIQNTIFKITTFLGLYICWKYNNPQVAYEAARFINTKLRSLYQPTHQKFEYKGVGTACNLFGFLSARILDSKMSLNNIHIQDWNTYEVEKKMFSLQPGDSVVRTNKKSSLIWEMHINKDLGFMGALPSGQIYTNCQKYDKLYALSCQAQLIKHIDATISDNLSNMVDEMNRKIRHNSIAIPNLNMFYSLERKYVQPLKTSQVDNYGIETIPTLKYLRYFDESMVFATRGMSLDTIKQPALIYDTLEDTTIGLYDIMSVSPILSTNDNTGIIPFNKAGLIYNFDNTSYDYMCLMTSLNNITNSCVFVIDDTRAIKVQTNINFTFNPNLWYSELIDIDVGNKLIIITRIIDNKSATLKYKMNMDDNGNTFTIETNMVCKSVQTYKIESHMWNWVIYENDSDLPETIEHNGDNYRIMPPVNFNTPIMKNGKYWLLCPDFNNGKYDEIKILLPSLESESKVDDMVTFEYSRHTHGQWVVVE